MQTCMYILNMIIIWNMHASVGVRTKLTCFSMLVAKMLLLVLRSATKVLKVSPILS